MLKMMEKEMKKEKFGLESVDSECECSRSTEAWQEGEKWEEEKEGRGMIYLEALRLMWKGSRWLEACEEGVGMREIDSGK